jgi:hypothetical protein
LTGAFQPPLWAPRCSAFPPVHTRNWSRFCTRPLEPRLCQGHQNFWPCALSHDSRPARPKDRPCSRTPARWASKASSRSAKTTATAPAARRTGSKQESGERGGAARGGGGMGQVKRGPVTILAPAMEHVSGVEGPAAGMWRKRHPQRSLPSSRAACIAGRPQRRHPRQASLSDEEPC